MDNKDLAQPNGLPIGSIAPIFEAFDINNSKFNLLNSLKDYGGVLLDFFIASW
jgi:hypothetical protein